MTTLEYAQVSQASRAVRTALDNSAARWHVPTQAWVLRDDAGQRIGDALVVVVNTLTDNALPYVFIRQGNEVKTVRAQGVVQAMNQLGIESKVS